MTSTAASNHEFIYDPSDTISSGSNSVASGGVGRSSIPDMLHFVKVKDYEAQTATTFCGLVDPLWAIPPEGSAPEAGIPACGACFSLAAQMVDGLMRKQVDEVADRLDREISRRLSRRIDAEDAITLRLERLEKKAAKKRGGRR